MPQRKQIKPGDKVGLKLTAAERMLILNDLIGVDQKHIQTIRDTPPEQPVQFTLDELDDLGGYIAAEANHTTDKKLGKTLDRVFEKIQDLLDQHTDEETAPALKVFSPSDDADRERAVKIAEFAAGILAMADRKEPKGSPQLSRTQTAKVKFTKPQRAALLELTSVKEPLRTLLDVESKGPRTFKLMVNDLASLCFAISEAMLEAEEKDKVKLLSTAERVLDGLHRCMEDVRDEAQDTKTVYQIKVTLDNIAPPIWRRFQVEDCTLADLHAVIQMSMGWYNSHLHMFTIGGEQYTDPEMGGDPDETSTHSESLAHLVDQGHRTFRYIYDFGDSWEHTIEVEEVLPSEPKTKYPRCVEGKRACPPEDCGGPWGYQEFLAVIQNPKHEEHGDMLEWVGGTFAPEKFSAAAVNKDMRKWFK